MAGLIGQMLDHYRLVEQIGRGGMATVYRALNTKSGDEVAIKVLSPTITGDRRFIKRFRREAGLVKRLQHPNIVPVLDYGECRGFIFLVMPFVEGETLLDRMVKRGVNESEASRWIGEIADALLFAHQNGIIHRDIKPSNIMIDRIGKAMLTDFGLARMVEGSNTLTGSMLMGTPAYVSPEQGKGLKLDERSDQYSLGVVLYQLSTGKLPFDSDAPMALVLMHMQEPVPRPSRFNRNLLPPVENVILKSMAKEPDQRFKDVGELKKAYQAALAGDSIPWVKPPSVPIPRVQAIPARVVKEESPHVPKRRGIPSWVFMLFGVPFIIGAAVVVLNVLGGLETAEGGIEPVQVNTQLVETTPLVMPTATQIPATETPVTSASCPGLRLFGFEKSGNEVVWNLDNASGKIQQIVDIKLVYPVDNPVESIWLGGDLLADGSGDGSGSDQNGTVSSSEATVLEIDQLKELALQFQWADDQPGYNLELYFRSGCILQTDW